MFFENLDDISRIATKNGATVFVIPDDIEFSIKRAMVLEPEVKTNITIEQVRQVISHLGVKQLSDQFVVIRPADLLNEEAANALLKNLEEPRQMIHFVLLTENPSKLLPTILSRAPVYRLKDEVDFSNLRERDERIKTFAKRLLVSKGADLTKLAEEISKEKKQPRKFALDIIGTAIEMLYKTYFINNQKAFVSKIPKFLAAYDNVARNGHIKLHLVADLC